MRVLLLLLLLLAFFGGWQPAFRCIHRHLLDWSVGHEMVRGKKRRRRNELLFPVVYILYLCPLSSSLNYSNPFLVYFLINSLESIPAFLLSAFGSLPVVHPCTYYPPAIYVGLFPVVYIVNTNLLDVSLFY